MSLEVYYNYRLSFFCSQTNNLFPPWITGTYTYLDGVLRYKKPYTSNCYSDNELLTFLQPMTRKRRYLSSVALNSRLYAIGGYDASSRLNTVECFDPSTAQWSVMTPMLQRRGLAGATTLAGMQSWHHNNEWCINNICQRMLTSNLHSLSLKGLFTCNYVKTVVRMKNM